jgi:hypothetical protein
MLPLSNFLSVEAEASRKADEPPLPTERNKAGAFPEENDLLPMFSPSIGRVGHKEDGGND